MAESVYKVIELVGTSTTSWEKAASAAVATASKSLRDLRVAEVTQMDLHIVDGKVLAYRARVKVSFKYATDDDKASKSEPAAAAPAAKRPARVKAAPAFEDLPITPVKRVAKKAKRAPAKR